MFLNFLGDSHQTLKYLKVFVYEKALAKIPKRAEEELSNYERLLVWRARVEVVEKDCFTVSQDVLIV